MSNTANDDSLANELENLNQLEINPDDPNKLYSIYN